MCTADDLARLARACGAKPNAAVVQGIVDNQEWLEAGGVDRPGREAEFLAQACLETDYFRVLGENASGKAYEGRKDLGALWRSIAESNRSFRRERPAS